MKPSIVYSFKECPYCQEIKELLTKDNIEFTDVDITLKENEEEYNEIMKIAKSEMVPIVRVGNQLLVPNVSFKSINECHTLVKKFLA